jgi:hypothetical protein
VVYVPNWCLADCKLGSITLSLDGPACLDAYVLPEDVGLDPTEKAVCLGSEIINFLFDDYLLKLQSAPKQAEPVASKTILVELPSEVWVASMVDGVCMFVTKIDEWNGNERVPAWVQEVLRGTLPAMKRASIRIKPTAALRNLSSNTNLKDFNSLTSHVHLKLTKYISYYVTEVLRLESMMPTEEQELCDMFSVRCKGKEVSNQMTLATLKNCIWKSSGDPLIDLDMKPSLPELAK